MYSMYERCSTHYQNEKSFQIYLFFCGKYSGKLKIKQKTQKKNLLLLICFIKLEYLFRIKMGPGTLKLALTHQKS